MHIIVLAAILILPVSHPSSQVADNSGQTNREEIRELKGRLVKRLPLIPQFRGARVSRSYEKREPGKVGYEATWTVNTPVSKVGTWYKRVLPLFGWKILEYNEGADEQNMLVQKRGRRAYLWIERKDHVTEITVEFPMLPEVR